MISSKKKKKKKKLNKKRKKKKKQRLLGFFFPETNFHAAPNAFACICGHKTAFGFFRFRFTLLLLLRITHQRVLDVRVGRESFVFAHVVGQGAVAVGVLGFGQVHTATKAIECL